MPPSEPEPPAPPGPAGAARDPAPGTAAAKADERRAITGRAGIVAAGTLVSRLLGLGRDLVLAGMFTRAATDAFMVAFTIPNTLRQLLAEGAVQTAVLPVLARTREQQGEEAARRFFAAARGVSWTILGVVSVLGVLLAEPLVDLFAGGFDAVQHARTVELLQWMFPYIFFMGTAALGAAALNASKRFVVTAFAPGLLNVACIAASLALPAWLAARGHEPILAMAAGVLVGGVLQVAAQWPSLRAAGYSGAPAFDFSHPGVRDALRRMGPVLLGLGVYLADVVIARRLLSDLGEGAQTYFGFALRLCDFPQGIFVMAIQTAALPSLAALAARGDKEELEATFAFGARLTLFVAIAAAALFIALPGPIVALLFQRGEFDALATSETARALVAQGAGIWTVALVRQLVAVFFAVGDTRTPVIVSALDLIVFVVLALALRGPLGHVGISVAVAGSSAVQMVLLFAALRLHLESRRLGEIGASALRTLGASVAAAFAARFVAAEAAGASLGVVVTALSGVTTFGLVFLTLARLLGSDELRIILRVVRRR